MNDRIHLVLVVALCLACCGSVGGIGLVAAFGHEAPAELSTVAWSTTSALIAMLVKKPQDGQGDGGKATWRGR